MFITTLCFVTIVTFHITLLHHMNCLALWYLLHSIGNMFIIYQCLEPIGYILNDPLYHLFNPTPFYDSMYTVALLHIYHMLFFCCTRDDIFHHIVFVGIGSFVIYTFNNGYYAALTHFFICGLPGCIDYFMLFLYKTDHIVKDTRLKYAMLLNVWIRSPGLCMLASFALINFIYKPKTLHSFIEVILQLTLTIGNGQMYMKDVVFSYGRRFVN